MKKSKRIKKGLAILLCSCMVPGTTPFPARAESFIDGFATETENTNGGGELFTVEGGDAGISVQSQEPAAVETEVNPGVDTSSQMPASVEPEANAESNSEPQTPASGEPETNTGSDVPTQDSDGSSSPETPAAVEKETDTGVNAPSQDLIVIEPETESGTNAPSQNPAETEPETNAPAQDPVVIEPEAEPSTEPSTQDPVEEVQKWIHALPDAREITEENLEEVMAQLDAIDEKKATLTEEQTARLDFTRYDEAAAAVMALMGMEGANEIVTLTIYDTKTVSYIGENGTQTTHLAEIVTGQYQQHQFTTL